MPTTEQERVYERSGRRRNLAVAALLFAILATMWSYASIKNYRLRGTLREQEFASVANSIAETVGQRIANRLRALEYMQTLARNGAFDAPGGFDIAAGTTREFAREFLAINLIDADRHIVRVWPMAGNLAVLGQTVGQSAAIVEVLETARDTDTPRSTGLVDLFQGGRGIATYFPIRRDGRFAGYINGVFRIDGLVTLVETPNALTYSIQLGSQPELPVAPGSRRYAIPILDRTLTLDFAAERPKAEISSIAEELAFGFVLSVACAALLYAGLMARRASARQQAMLSGILTSAPDAIVSIDAGGRIVVFTPAAERMFQRNAEDVIGAPLDLLLPPGAVAAHAEHVDGFSRSRQTARVMGDWRKVRGMRANGQTFPVMAHIARTQFEGRALLTAILRDMTETERVNAELSSLADERTRQAERADAANQAKTMFLATMSHELRTPLNAIIGFSDIASRELLGPLGNPRYKEYLQDIRQSGENLLAIVDSVLDLSKAEVGAYRFDTMAFDLSEALASTARQLAPLMESKQLAFAQELPDRLMTMGDPRATRQIAVNLLSNAIKFTAAGGKLTMSARTCADPHFVEFAIADTGRGMSTDDLNRVGKPFVQVGDAYRSEVKGTGLGLAITRAFAAGMGGRVEIASELGAGTTVVVRLPAAGGTSPTPPPPEIRPT